ncbi:hypothetical protein SAMN04487989_10116 [Bizionia echini]|uniref:Uncharacterized protein n=1 Tax=Bizionia echini TaxID=649333 RepID=A0A1I4YHY9_9FLAO|nr:hypothetical protein SAMN04487989_10116 [Bizionia echini]
MPLPSLTHEPGTSESSFHLKRKIGILCILKINGLSVFNLVYTDVVHSVFIRLMSYQLFQGFELLYYLNQIPLEVQRICRFHF